MTATSITRIRPTRAAWNTPPAALRTSTTPRWDGKSPGKSPRAGRMSSTRPTARSAANWPDESKPLPFGMRGSGSGGEPAAAGLAAAAETRLDGAAPVGQRDAAVGLGRGRRRDDGRDVEGLLLVADRRLL